MNIELNKLSEDTRFTLKYELKLGGLGSTHYYSLVHDKLGAAHIWISEREDKQDWFGGLGFHHTSPPDYMEDDPPSSDPCEWIGKPCWHDGSALIVHDNIIPYWSPGDHLFVFNKLIGYAIDSLKIVY